MTNSRFTFFSNDNEQQVINEPLVTNGVVDFKPAPNSNQRFLITHQSNLYALNSSVVDLKAESTWNIKDLQVAADGYIVHMEVEKHELFNKNPALNDMLNFSKLFNLPIQQLSLKLNTNGEVVEVLNQAEIFEKWQLLKQEIGPTLQGDPNADFIYQNGDKQFGNSLGMIRDTTIYKLFFTAQYGTLKKGDTKQISSGKLASQMFQSKEIPYNVIATVKDINQSVLTVAYETSISGFDKKPFEEIYNSVYKEAMGDTFKYRIGYHGDYLYNIRTGMIMSGAVYISEYANDNLFFEESYLIKPL